MATLGYRDSGSVVLSKAEALRQAHEKEGERSRLMTWSKRKSPPRRKKDEREEREKEEAAEFEMKLENIIQKRPDKRLKWLQKGMIMVGRKTIKANAFFDLIMDKVFISDVPAEIGTKMKASVLANLHLFSSKQQKALQSVLTPMTLARQAEVRLSASGSDAKAFWTSDQLATFSRCFEQAIGPVARCDWQSISEQHYGLSFWPMARSVNDCAFMSILSEKAHPERPVMVALDTEFPGFLLEDHPFAPRSARYTALRENVDYLWPIQFGLAVADSDGAPLGAWTFNLSFNLATSLYSEDSVRFLQATGVDFPRHAVEGIEPSTLAWKLSRSPLVGMHRNSPEWVTFSGWYDWGYLLKLVTGNPMPYDINAFDELLSTLCPTRKELRDLLPRGSLDALLGSHGLRRLGPAHTAGSDALATLELFLHVRMNGTNEEAAKALTLADGKALIDPVAPSDDIADAENSGTSTATGTTDDAQASSRDVSADVENEPCVSEAGSHSGSEPWKQISDEEPELWEVPHRHHHRLELRGLRRVRHRHRGPRHRYVDDGPPFPVPHRWHFDSTVTERSRPLSERILEFIDIENEVWEPVLKVFHATGYTSLFFIIAIFTLTVFSALYLLL